LGCDIRFRMAELAVDSRCHRRSRSDFNHEAAALDVTEVTQPLAEGLLEVRGRVGCQVAYSR